MMMRSNAVVATACLLLSLSGSALLAQRQARVWGTVVDESDQPVAGVAVQVVHPDTGSVMAKAVTDESGKYSITLVDASRPYVYRLVKEGHVPFETEIDVDVGTNSEYNFKLPTEGSLRGGGDGQGGYQMPNEAVEPFNQGVAAARAGDWQTAAARFEAVLEIDDTIAPAWAALGGIYMNLGRPEEALAAAARGLEIEPGNRQAQTALEGAAQTLTARGEGLFNSGDVAGAATLLQQVVDAVPEFAPAQLQLGFALNAAGDAAGAKTHLERFLELAPEHPDAALAREMLGYLSGSSG